MASSFSILNMFRQKARPVRSILEDPSRHVLRMFATTETRGASYSEIMAAEAAMRHPVVARCMHKIALAVQDVPWYVVQNPNAAEKMDKARAKKVQDVLDHPNDSMSASQLRYWLGINKAAYNRYAIKVGALTTGGPNAIYPLSQGQFKTKYKSNGIVDKYTYGPNCEENLQTRRQVDPGFSGDFKKAFGYEYVTPSIEGLMDPMKLMTAKNNTPLNSIGYPAEIVKLLLQRAYDTASGQPNVKYIISGEKTLTGPQQDELEDELDDHKPGAEDSGNILFLANTSIKIDTLNNGMEDIHSKIPMDDMSRIIYSNWGIPVALAGIGSSDAAKFAGNYEASRRSFFEDTIIPNYLGPIADGLTEAIAPPGGMIIFDLDSIPGLADARANKAKTLQGVDFLTKEEKRILCSFPAEPEKYNEQSSSSQEGTSESEESTPDVVTSKRGRIKSSRR
jgi:phage portal protein BeeE